MKKIASFITDTLVKDGQIPESQQDIYRYLFDYLFESLLFDVITLIIGLVTHRFGIALCYILVTIPLRHFAGGFHAGSPLMCTILSYGIYGLILFSAPYLIKLPDFIWIPVYVVMWLFILLVAPVDCPNKRLLPEQKKRLFKLCILSCIVISIIFIILRINGAILYVASISECLTVCTIGLYIGIFRNKKQKQLSQEDS